MGLDLLQPAFSKERTIWFNLVNPIKNTIVSVLGIEMSLGTIPSSDSP